MIRTAGIRRAPGAAPIVADLHTKEATAAGESALRLHLVAAWRHSTVFTEAERAAPARAEEGTRLADARQVFARSQS